MMKNTKSDQKQNSQASSNQKSRIGSGASFGIGALIGVGAMICAQVIMSVGMIAAATVGMGTILAGSTPVWGLAGGAIAGLGIAAIAGYGVYKGASALYTGIRDSERLDKVWTSVGALAGALGLLFSMSGADVDSLDVEQFPDMDFIEFPEQERTIESMDQNDPFTLKTRHARAAAETSGEKVQTPSSAPTHKAYSIKL